MFICLIIYYLTSSWYIFIALSNSVSYCIYTMLNLLILYHFLIVYASLKFLLNCCSFWHLFCVLSCPTFSILIWRMQPCFFFLFVNTLYASCQLAILARLCRQILQICPPQWDGRNSWSKSRLMLFKYMFCCCLIFSPLCLPIWYYYFV